MNNLRKTAERSSKPAQTCVLVLGMHRSGTSAMTRLVSMVGAALPRNIAGASAGNETGHWEPERLIAYHDRMLAGLGSAWHDWAALDLKSLTIERREQIVADLGDLVDREFADSPLFVIKEPRIARFAGFFGQILSRKGIEIRAIVAFRNPLDVIDSLIARKSVWPADYDRADAALLWLSHMLGAELAARDWPHVFLSYEAVMADPVAAMQRAVKAIGIDAPITVAEAAPDMAAFINDGHRHHARPPEDVWLDPQLSGWVADSYSALRDLEASRNLTGARETLDRVRREFNSALPILEVTTSARRAAFHKARAAQIRNQQLVDERAALTEELRESRSALNAELAEARDAAQDAQARAEATEARFVQAQAEIEDLRRANAQLRVQIEGESENPELARQALADFAAREAELQGEISRLKAELNSSETATRPWRERLAEASELASKQAVQLSERDTLIEANEARLAEARDEIEKLTSEAASGKARLKDLEAALDGARADLARRVDEAKAASHRLADKSQALDASIARIGSLSSELSEMTEAYDQSVARIAETHALYRSSTSWRLTAPLRGIMSLALRSYRAIYRRSGLALRSILPDNAVNRIKRLVPDPQGIPHQLTYQPIPTRPANAFLASIAGPAERPDIFVFSIIDWDFRTQRPQHIARLLSENHRVFYVEMMLGMGGMTVREIDERLYVVRLARNSIGHIQPYVGEADEDQLRGWIDSLFDFADQVNATPFKHVIIQHPFWWQMARHLPPEFEIVFDCMDEIAGFSNTSEWLLEAERGMLAGCDKLVVSSDYLFDKYAAIKPPTLIRNGGDLTHFERNESNAALPQFLAAHGFAKRNGIIDVGYVGAIAEWFDADLVRAVANANPDMDFHLCGAVTTQEAARLESLANVRLYGEITYAEVPAFIRQMDVMIIPFQLLPIIKACDPVKFYEYSAMGKPTVATELPELNRARELLFLSTGPVEFAANIRKAHEEGRSREFRDCLRAYAAANTWRHRSELFEQVLEDLPKVSVVILSYGDPIWTVTTLHSLFEGGPAYPNMEVLVVDNGSPEEWLAAIREAIGRTPPDTVRLIENGENLGFARGNNVGIAQATGDYVLLLNNDTYVAPGAIAAMVSQLRANPDIGVVGPLTNNIGNEARVEIHYADMAEMKRRARDLTLGYRGMHSEMRVAAYFAAMFRREDFDRFGLLSEDYGLGMFEDDDHCAVIRSKGYICALAEDAFIHHHLSATFDALGAERKRKLFEANKKTFEARWGKWVPHKYRAERPASGLRGNQ